VVLKPQPVPFEQMSLRKDILLLSGILVAQRELPLREDNGGGDTLVLFTRKKFPLVAGNLTGGWKCHAGMTNCEYVASAGAGANVCARRQFSSRQENLRDWKFAARAEILERSKISVYAPRFPPAVCHTGMTIAASVVESIQQSPSCRRPSRRQEIPSRYENLYARTNFTTGGTAAEGKSSLRNDNL
jgi:hypothetical protein